MENRKKEIQLGNNLIEITTKKSKIELKNGSEIMILDTHDIALLVYHLKKSYQQIKKPLA